MANGGKNSKPAQCCARQAKGAFGAARRIQACSLLVQKLVRPLARLDNGFDQGDTQAAIFKLHEPVNVEPPASSPDPSALPDVHP